MAIVITCVTGTATLGVPYSSTFVASGGTAPYVWSLSTGDFPPGLTLDGATGILSGTPTELGPFDYQIEVDDDAAGFALKNCSITVSPVPGAYPTPYRVTTLAGDLAQWTPWDGGAFRGANIQIPPFQFGGYTYVCYQNFAGLDINLCGSSTGDFLSVSSSPDGQNFTIQDQGAAPQISEVSWQAYWIEDFDNDRVIAVYQDFTTGEFTIIPFDLAPFGGGTWGTPLALAGPAPTSMTQGFIMPILVAAMTAADTFQVTYAEDIGGSAPDGVSIKTVQCVAGSWGSPLTLITGVAGGSNKTGFINGTVADADGITWIFDGWYTQPTGVRKMLCHRIDTDGTLLEETQIATSTGTTIPFIPSVPKYLAATDEVALPTSIYIPGDWTPTPPMHMCLIISPAAAPAFAFDGITDYFFDTPGSDTGPPYFFTPPDESVYYVGMCNRRNQGDAGPIDNGWEQIIFFQRDPGDMSWTGPTIFWDNEADQLASPLYHDIESCPDPGDVEPPAELNSLAIRVDAGGAVMLTCGMLSDWCGVEFYMSVGIVPSSGDVTFEKVVVGGTSVPADWTLQFYQSGVFIAAATAGNTVSLPGGDYQLVEVGPIGYSVVYGVTGDGSVTGATLTVDPDGTLTVTATNTFGTPALATLTLVKLVSGGAAPPTDWILTASGPSILTGPGGAAAVVVAGAYILTETSVAGYLDGSWSISGTGGALTIVAGVWTLTLAPGATITATVVNAFGNQPVADTPTLRYEIPQKRWFVHHYRDPMIAHYLDEPETNKPNDMQLLMLAGPNVFKSGGDLDVDADIESVLQLPSYDGGDERAQKLFIDAMLEADQTGDVTSLIQFNNQQVNGPSVVYSPTGLREQFLENISSLADLSLYRNISARFTWMGGPSGPRLYAFEPSGYAQPYLSTAIVTQFINLAFPGWKHHRRLYAGLISNSTIMFTIKTQDGRTYVTQIPSTGGQFKIIPLMIPHGCKDLAFAYELDGQGVAFALFPDAFTLETKEWTQPAYIELAVWNT